MSQPDNFETPSRTLRGWDKLAAHYTRSRVTVREWVEKGCPYQLDGRVHIFDLDKVDEWLEARDGFDDDDDDNQGGGRKEFYREKLRKLKLESDKLQRDKDLAEKKTAHRDEFFEVYKRNMRKVVVTLDAHMKKVKKQIPNLSAEQSEKLDAILIDTLNEIAELPAE